MWVGFVYRQSHARRPGDLGHFFNTIPLQIVVESSNDCPNVLLTDKRRSSMLHDPVFTQMPAHREYVNPSDIPMSPFIRDIDPPSPPRVVA